MKAFAALLLGCLSAVPAAAIEVPLTVHGRMLMVDVTINDRFTGRFLLDTGASFVAISQDTARKAAIKDRNSRRKIRLTTAAGPVEAIIAEVRKIELGNATARDVEVAILEEEPAPGFAGLLGMSFLSRFSYSLDAEKGTLRLLH